MSWNIEQMRSSENFDPTFDAVLSDFSINKAQFEKMSVEEISIIDNG